MPIAVFRSRLREEHAEEFRALAAEMMALAESMPGFRSYEVYTDEAGGRCSVIEFESMETLEAWRTHPRHLAAQARRERYYAEYRLHVGDVVRVSALRRRGCPDAVARRSYSKVAFGGCKVPNLQQTLIGRLEALGVEHVPYPGRDDGFCGLRYGGKEFAHFHDFHELDLKLSAKRIRAEGLAHPKDSRVHPKRRAGSPWIELRFRKRADLDEIVRLVKLAIGHG